jgi:hypothetical protein
MSSFGPARPSIRDILIGQSPHGAFSGLSGNEVARLFVEAYSESLPRGMAAGYAFGNRMGVRSTGRAAREFREPYATVVFALAQALQHQRRYITALYDTPQGCVIEAALPFNMLSFGGDLLFEVVDGGAAQTRIEGTSVIAGQLFAWGKGKRALKAALNATHEYILRRQRGAEVIWQPPRPLGLFGYVIAWLFGMCLFVGTFFVVINSIGAIVDGRFTVALLGNLVLFGFGIPLVMIMVGTLLFVLISVKDWLDEARRRRMRHGSEPHHP